MLKFKLGGVFVAADGREWVYIGYKEPSRHSKAHRQHTFELARHQRKGVPHGSFTFNAVKLETILAKFSNAREHLEHDA